MDRIVLDEIRTGTPRALGGTDILSAIDKQRTEGPARIERLGIVGDSQADRSVHGGVEKAVLHYAAHHYAAWLTEVPHLAAKLVPGGFGENLVSSGLDETGVCIGDVVQIGGAVLQVSQPRQPCFKLNHRFGEPSMSRRVQQSCRTGWYYRVLEPGTVQAGDEIRVTDRPHADWPVRRIQLHLYTRTADPEALEQLSRLSVLAEGMRGLFAQRLASSSVESWQRRLTGIE
jgi:MOSC domain-containing protein YiiM